MRLSLALSEISHHSEYKYVLVNDKINETVKNLMTIIEYNLLNTSLKKKLNKSLKIIK